MPCEAPWGADARRGCFAHSAKEFPATGASEARSPGPDAPEFPARIRVRHPRPRTLTSDDAPPPMCGAHEYTLLTAPPISGDIAVQFAPHIDARFLKRLHSAPRSAHPLPECSAHYRAVLGRPELEPRSTLVPHRARRNPNKVSSPAKPTSRSETPNATHAEPGPQMRHTPSPVYPFRCWIARAPGSGSSCPTPAPRPRPLAAHPQSCTHGGGGATAWYYATHDYGDGAASGDTVLKCWDTSLLKCWDTSRLEGYISKH